MQTLTEIYLKSINASIKVINYCNTNRLIGMTFNDILQLNRPNAELIWLKSKLK